VTAGDRSGMLLSRLARCFAQRKTASRCSVHDLKVGYTNQCSEGEVVDGAALHRSLSWLRRTRTCAPRSDGPVLRMRSPAEAPKQRAGPTLGCPPPTHAPGSARGSQFTLTPGLRALWQARRSQPARSEPPSPLLLSRADCARAARACEATRGRFEGPPADPRNVRRARADRKPSTSGLMKLTFIIIRGKRDECAVGALESRDAHGYFRE